MWLVVDSLDYQHNVPYEPVDTAFGLAIDLPTLKHSLKEFCPGLRPWDVLVTDACYDNPRFEPIWDVVMEHCHTCSTPIPTVAGVSVPGGWMAASPEVVDIPW